MTSFVRDQPIRHVKLSNLSLISDTEKSTVRITGNVDEKATNGNELVLVNAIRTGNNIEEDRVSVNLNLLDDFNLKNMNINHDLVQFIGSRQFSSETNEDCIIKFKALYFRFIRRTSLENYYAALKVQEDYLKN